VSGLISLELLVYFAGTNLLMRLKKYLAGTRSIRGSVILNSSLAGGCILEKILAGWPDLSSIVILSFYAC
jgi:hypothetical protein